MTEMQLLVVMTYLKSWPEKMNFYQIIRYIGHNGAIVPKNNYMNWDSNDIADEMIGLYCRINIVLIDLRLKRDS